MTQKLQQATESLAASLAAAHLADLSAVAADYDKQLAALGYECRCHTHGGRSRISHLEHARWLCSRLAESWQRDPAEARQLVGLLRGILLRYEIITA